MLAFECHISCYTCECRIIYIVYTFLNMHTCACIITQKTNTLSYYTIVLSHHIIPDMYIIKHIYIYYDFTQIICDMHDGGCIRVCMVVFVIYV